MSLVAGLMAMVMESRDKDDLTFAMSKMLAGELEEDRG